MEKQKGREAKPSVTGKNHKKEEVKKNNKNVKIKQFPMKKIVVNSKF